MDTSLLSSMYDEDGRDISALIEEAEEKENCGEDVKQANG